MYQKLVSGFGIQRWLKKELPSGGDKGEELVNSSSNLQWILAQSCLSMKSTEAFGGFIWGGGGKEEEALCCLSPSLQLQENVETDPPPPEEGARVHSGKMFCS